MRKIKGNLGILLFGLMALANTSQAALNDLGNGLVNDDVLNITWVLDANLFKTLCDANDPLATGFTPVDTADAATVCTNNGAMTWNDAEAWILRLNAQSYLGFTDWRQPATSQPDLTCESTFAPSNNGGFNCRGSELGNLFNISLANPNDGGTGTGLDGSTGTVGSNCFVSGISNCFQNTASFINAQALAYWSGSEFAPNTFLAWLFSTDIGFQSNAGKGNFNLFVWPVRSGQSVVAPIAPQNVPTLSVWGVGIMSLLLAFVARRKVR